MDSNKEQFSLIYDQYISKIYRFVYLKVNSPEIAEDISSKVFVKGWEAYQKDSNAIRNIGAFLYQIARNMVTDYYRKKGGTATVSSEHAAQLVDTKIDVHESAVQKADIEIIKAGLGQLKQEYQDVLIWHYLEDLSVPEIAQLIDKPEGTVRVILHRGIQNLKDVIEQG